MSRVPIATEPVGKRAGQDNDPSPFDRYQAVFGDLLLDVETMRGIRETEDRLIELGRMDQAGRFPVPDYLAKDWAAAEADVEEG